MLRQLFHPAVSIWFEKTFQTPTEVQLRAWTEISKQRNTLIAAPTGSGKTLAAFLAAIDDLVKKSIAGTLENTTQVVYISPLKALSNDIQRNLQFPLKGITEELKAEGFAEPNISVMVRTGDTPTAERTAMIKHPPHILVTTPESIYLLLTSVNGRKMLSSVHTLIVDEIHALVDDKRGSHLSLSVERLEALAGRKLMRIGLSATQKPIEQIADFLTGISDTSQTPSPLGEGRGEVISERLAFLRLRQRTQGGSLEKSESLESSIPLCVSPKRGEALAPHCSIVNTGHSRKLDLALEMPRSPLSAIMSNEVWLELYDKIESLIKEHKTTLIFVNTRRLAERMAHNLTERLGEEVITAHHGSMSKDHRFDAEQRLKSGSLRCLVATASLELGIDIGSVDLVCQIGSPRAISTFLQRVGRSGHSVKGTPKGRLFPLSIDDLLECTALLDSVKRGELDKIIMPEKPLDILAQQIVAEVSCKDYTTDELFKMVTRAYPYRDLSRKEFDEVVKMLSEGFTTRNGRRSAYLHYDMVNERVIGRKGARLTALLSGGAIPDNFDYDVVLEPENIPIGTLNEDFAIESMEGDIFQLGNSSWRIVKIETGKVRVEDAQGQAPTIPFWLGEAPGRTAELSESVSRLKHEISLRLGDLSDLKPLEETTDEKADTNEFWKKDALAYLINELQLPEAAADQLTTYLATGKAALTEMPTQDTLILERFFDEAGDMHLVIHSTYGSRLNRAWGLALRKKFCRKFNFELQAAATENAIILSLGATHSFPLEEVFDYLSAKTVRNTLTQALLDAPMFGVRWRWNASRALAIPRRRGGKKVPPQIQRSLSEDLVALVFPDQLACLENITGEREIPDHPLVNQTVHDCLYEAMDIEELEKLLTKIKAGDIKLLAKDLREPSAFAADILNARPFAFLDDAPLEERRTNAVQNRRWMDPAAAKDLGKLDIEAIRTVQAEAWPQAATHDELHDALVLFGFITEEEGKKEHWENFFHELIAQQRATLVDLGTHHIWVATERIPQIKSLFPDAKTTPVLKLPEKLSSSLPLPDEALKELVRGRLEALGPVQAVQIATSMNLPVSRIDFALISLENEGFVFRGNFTPDINATEWCERRLLARIHRNTLGKLRKEIEPVSTVDFMRFLFSWNHLDAANQQDGIHALEKVIEQLEGYEAQAASWESDILPARVKDYDHQWLDGLCLSGKILWGRFRQINSDNTKGGNPVKTSPITLIQRANVSIIKNSNPPANGKQPELSANATHVVSFLKKNGASFYHDIVNKAKMLESQVEDSISELVAKGFVTADSYTGLRALLVPAKYTRDRHKSKVAFSMEHAGRWSLIQHEEETSEDALQKRKRLEAVARILLRRYGVVFRRLADRESLAPAWWELVRVLRMMEARGEVRGGRFVQGVYGEQYALPEAVNLLRRVRREEKKGTLISISAADPLNLTGILTTEKRTPAIYTNRILFEDGKVVGVKEGKEITIVKEAENGDSWRLKNALIQRRISPRLRAYLGKGIL
ncbi:MAG: DEAD/DEAH box helicase [Chitinophagales bacterium]|nr:DEAD/DEAH box helicase [Chitinophagales bacterium]